MEAKKYGGRNLIGKSNLPRTWLLLLLLFRYQGSCFSLSVWSFFVGHIDGDPRGYNGATSATIVRQGIASVSAHYDPGISYCHYTLGD